VGQISVTQQINLAIRIEADGSVADSAPNTGTQAGNTLFDETGLYTGGYFQANPILTTLQSKPPSPFMCHRTWAMGRGRGMERGGGRLHW